MTADRTPFIDWPRLLGDLQYLLGEPLHDGSPSRTPVGTPALAKFLDVKRTTLVGWLEGSEPKHSQGEALITAWVSITGKSRSFAPITVRTFSSAKVR
jgi:hypothetical protein